VTNHRAYLDIFLKGLNLLYLALWVTYVIVAYVWYSYGIAQAGYLVGFFRSKFDILGLNWEAVHGGSFAVLLSTTWTILDWACRTIRRDFVSLSLLSSILYLVQARLSRSK
jgi:hypothetical protein